MDSLDTFAQGPLMNFILFAILSVPMWLNTSGIHASWRATPIFRILPKWLKLFFDALPKASACPMGTFASPFCSSWDVADPPSSYFLTWPFPKLVQMSVSSLYLCNSRLREYISGSSKNFLGKTFQNLHISVALKFSNERIRW